MSDYRLFNVFDIMREGAAGYRTVSDAVETTANDILTKIQHVGAEVWKDGVFDTFWEPALQRSNSEHDTSERHANRALAMDNCTDAGESTSAQACSYAAGL
jgi:hypothetical protein